MRMASSSGVHLEFSFNRLSPKVVDIGGELFKLEEGGGEMWWDGSLVRAFGREPRPDIYVLV